MFGFVIRKARTFSFDSRPQGPIDQPNTAPARTVPRPPLGRRSMSVAFHLAELFTVLVSLGLLTNAIRRQKTFALDIWVPPFLHGFQPRGLDTVMNALMAIGSLGVIPPILLLAVIALVRKQRYDAMTFLGVAAIGGVVIGWVMKIFIARPLPQVAWASELPDYGFPSGHTMDSTVFYLALALILLSVFGRRVGGVATSIAIILFIGVGVSRIYLGYHYVTDVTGGILAGAVWLMIVIFAFRLQPKWWSWGSVLTPTKGSDGPKD